MIGLWGCKQEVIDYEAQAARAHFYHQTQKDLTDIMVHDIFSPPVASRVYAYCNIAAYETMQQGDERYRSLAGQLTDLTPAPKPETGKEIFYPLAATQAFLHMKRKLVFSEDKIQAFEDTIHQQFRQAGVPSEVFANSLAYGEQVGAHIAAWADQDNYKQTRTFPRYDVITGTDGRWTPTPPDYMDAIEPHWNKIRPFVIDSATQFIPVRPTAYDMNKQGKFYAELMEVYAAVKDRTKETEEIAQFWDCNPFATQHIGHVTFAIKKISPGGHWMGISGQALRKQNADFAESIAVYAYVAISLADGFISCWDEKYRSNLIRPETVINEHVDAEWRPLLQTPPFPEYTSGHSVISTAAAIALTDWFGDSFAFTDSVELEFDLGIRSYDSFIEASQEAAVSRLYGGIHYRPAIDEGVAQGKKVGSYIVNNLELKATSGTAAKESEATKAAPQASNNGP